MVYSPGKLDFLLDSVSHKLLENDLGWPVYTIFCEKLFKYTKSGAYWWIKKKTKYLCEETEQGNLISENSTEIESCNQYKCLETSSRIIQARKTINNGILWNSNFN